MFHCLTGFPHDNLFSKSKCRKCSGSTILEVESGRGVTLLLKKKKKKTSLSATPQVPGLVRASSRNVTEMNGSVSPASHATSALFFIHL